MTERVYPKTIIVDFDGTICGFLFPECGPPELHVREGLQKLRDAGFEIVIHSVSTNSNWGFPSTEIHFNRIEVYMAKHNLPYDRIMMECDKPFAAAYIDDRSVGYRGNWLEAAKEAIELGNKE